MARVSLLCDFSSVYLSRERAKTPFQHRYGWPSHVQKFRVTKKSLTLFLVSVLVTGARYGTPKIIFRGTRVNLKIISQPSFCGNPSGCGVLFRTIVASSNYWEILSLPKGSLKTRKGNTRRINLLRSHHHYSL